MKENDSEYNLDKSFGVNAFRMVEKLVSFGPRYPGSEGHDLAVGYIRSELESSADDVFTQDFYIHFRGNDVKCSNIIGLFKAENSVKQTLANGDKRKSSLLIGTHFDTRIIADNESDVVLKNKPILGANDGGSGSAVELALAPIIKSLSLPYDVLLVFFDAEDVGNIDGNKFSMGALHYATNPIPADPGEVIVLDMVGGRDMIFDFDVHIIKYKESLALSLKLREIGKSKGFNPFVKFDIEKNAKYIICDHYPFLLNDIPTALLIDLNYPQWHTQMDIPKYLSSDSLWITGEVLVSYMLSR